MSISLVSSKCTRLDSLNAQNINIKSFYIFDVNFVSFTMYIKIFFDQMYSELFSDIFHMSLEDNFLKLTCLVLVTVLIKNVI